MPARRIDYTNHAWDKAAATVLQRRSGTKCDLENIDPGVNFFVLALEALGAKPKYSCEGHPRSFYICFQADYELALEIRSAGYFTVEAEGRDYWSIRKMAGEYMQNPYTLADRDQTLRWATDAWLSKFGERLAKLR